MFAGIPLAVVGLVFALVFMTTKKPSRDPVAKPVMDDDTDRPRGAGSA